MALESSGTILYVAKISYKSDNWFGNCQGGDQNFTQKGGGPKFYTDTHTDTHTHTQTHTHTPRPILKVLFFCENAETRLIKNNIFINCRPRWSHGYHTRHWIRGSRVQTWPGSRIFSERKNPEYDFLRKGSKAVGPVPQIYATLKNLKPKLEPLSKICRTFHARCRKRR